MKRILTRIAVVVLLVSAIGIPAGASESQPQGGSGSARVRMVDERFRPRTITVARGTLVRWVNRGNQDHTTTSNSGLWSSGRVDPGDSFRRRFQQAGTFAYRCTIHPQMRGTIIVE